MLTQAATVLILDFETRSRVDLPTRGSHVYATDLSTKVLCCAFGMLDRDEVWMYLNPSFYDTVSLMPDWALHALEDEDVLIGAHNAPFDQAIYEYVATTDDSVFFLPVNPDRWICTSAIARVNALPASLDNGTRALNSKHRKDHKGSALIRQLCIPDDEGNFNEDPGALRDLSLYCAKDLLATRELVRQCRPMTQDEHRDWRVNEAINRRGVRIDAGLARSAVKYAGIEATAIAKRLSVLTGGRITKHTQTARIRDYVAGELEFTETSTEVMAKYKNGVRKLSIDKAIRAELLERSVELNLHHDTVEVIQLTDDGNRSSVGKFKAMLNRMDPNTERVNGAFIYAGASTLRYTSRGLQLHNMVRDCFPQGTADCLAKSMQEGDPLHNVMRTLSKLLRPTLIPDEDHLFVTGDWSAIEAMGLPWLSDSAGGERMLDVFREGHDPYVYTAALLKLTERQIGKVALLSLGYGGAVGAFMAMARNYGVELPEYEVVAIVKKWRISNGWAPQFWYALHKAAIRAVQNPDFTYTAGRVSYMFVPALLDGTLLCMLPGDVVIQYPKARLIPNPQGGIDLTALKANWTPKADATEWPRYTLWHGLLAENATQAFCAGLLRHALRRLSTQESLGHVVSHCHDDIVMEALRRHAKAARELLDYEMNFVPDFATGLPLKAEPVISYRYGHK